MGKIVTLGEIMLRLSTHPGERIGQNKQFQAHFGGGEANVAISLANFGHDVSFASKVPNSSIGMSVKKHLQRYGVETTHLLFGGERLVPTTWNPVLENVGLLSFMIVKVRALQK